MRPPCWNARCGPLLPAVAIWIMCQAALPAADEPNVVLFLVDDMGYTDSSTYGSGYYETPNLERLASQGMRFTNAYAASPVCSPTRASILTGHTPARLRVTDWISGHGDAGKPLSEPAWTKQLRQDRLTLAEALKARGYATVHLGKWHLGQSGRSEADPTTQGFDINVGGNHRGQPNGSTGNYFADGNGSFGLPGLGNGSSAPGEYLTDRLTRSATDYVRQRAADGQPFFLYMSHYAVHTPLQAKPDVRQKYLNKPGVGGHNNATYAAMLESMDDSLGAIMDTLEDPNGDGDTGDSIADETVILFMSDNGGLGSVTSNAPLRAGKGTNYEGGIRTPMVVKWTGHATPGSLSHETVAAWDAYDTILEIAGTAANGPQNSKSDGVSLVPVLEGTGSRDGPLFFHYPHYHTRGARPHSAVREGDWKLILDYEDGSAELYNLASDVGETNDLAASNPAKVAELRGKLEHYLIDIDAQLPEGTPVVLPGKNMDAAGVISINLGTGANTTMNPQEFAGVVEENHWNNAISPGKQAGSGSIANLVDGNGDPTGAGFTFQAGYMNYNDNLGTADYRMMEGWGGNKASDVGNAFSVADLPDHFLQPGYDLYVYFDSNFEGATARRMSFTIGDLTVYGRELPTDFDGFFIEAEQTGVTGFDDAKDGNYVVFRDLHLADFDLTVDSVEGWRGTVNGLQIVQVPEPSCLVLLAALGAVALLCRRRWRGS